MSDFEIISVVIMIASLVLKAISFGRDIGNKKKHEKQSRHPARTGDGYAHSILVIRGEEPYQKRHPFLSSLYHHALLLSTPFPCISSGKTSAPTSVKAKPPSSANW